MWNIYKNDVKRISHNVFAIIIVIGITILPALYAWFNIGANFDPYSNTKNIKVAVANEDKSIHNDIAGDLSAGDDIISNLKENDKIGWVFTDRTAAVEGVHSGEYYAAIVIPEDFSAHLAGFLTSDAEKSQIIYYVNEKKNAIAPKITDSAAHALEANIQEMFYETASKSAMKIVASSMQEVSAKLDKADSDVVGVLEKTAKEMEDYQTQLDGFVNTIKDGKQAIKDGDKILESLDKAVADGQDVLSQSDDLLAQGRSNIGAFSANISTVLSDSEAVLGQINGDAAVSMGNLSSMARDINSDLNASIASLQDVMNDSQDVLSGLQQLGSSQLDDICNALSDQITNQQEILDQLGSGNNSISNVINEAAQTGQDINTILQDGGADFQSIMSSLHGDLLPEVNQNIDQFASLSGQTSGVVSTLPTMVEQLKTILKELHSGLKDAEKALADTKEIMSVFSEQIKQVLDDLHVVRSSGIYKELLSVSNINPDQIGNFMKSPATVKTELIYPVNNYGSALAPFYSNLAAWVGGIVLIAIFKLEVAKNKANGKVNATKEFLGRWLLFITVGMAQGLIIGLGNLYILKIQCENPLVFIGIGVFISLVYVTLIYSLTSAFKHIGKALCIILVILQIPGSAGTYPIEMTPKFFQAIHPFLPFTYGVGAMREAIAGIYWPHLIADLLHLLVFIGVAFIIGLCIRPLLLNLNHFFDKKLGETDMLVCESKAGVAREKGKIEAIVAVLARSKGALQDDEERQERFISAYQRRVKIGFILMLALPLLFLLLMFSFDAKVYFLVLWIVSIIAISVYLICLEYFKSKAEEYELIEKEVSSMGDLELIKFLRQKRGGDGK